MAPEIKKKEEVTVMILEVDLKCSCCYKKVKKLLCKFPQIRDQVFDEDKNKVMITVVCCNPEKLRDKLCCKGGRAIQSIEILDKKPPTLEKPPKQPENPPKEPPKQLDEPKPKPPPVVVPPPAPKPDPPKVKVDPPKKPDPPPMPQPEPVKMPDPVPPVPVPQPQPQPQPEPMKMPDPMPMDAYPYPYPSCPPVSVCCQECYEGRGGGPCHYGYGRPVPPPGPCYDGYGYQYRPCYVTRCDYFSEENPQGCSIM